MRNLPNLSYLQAFEAAARRLSFTEAAAELGCTQAAISQRVRGLEAQLKRQLFERRSNGLALTEAGESYLPGISEALNIAAGATEALQGRAARRAVTISAPSSFLSLWLIPRMHQLLADCPGVELRLNSTIWTDPNAEIADIIIEVREDHEADASLPRLADAGLTLVVAPDLAGAMGGRDPGEALRGLRQLHVQGRYGLWRRWAEGAGARLDPAASQLKLDTAASALEAATLALGATVVHSSYCRGLLRQGRLAAPFAPVPTSLRHCLFKPPGNKPRWHPAHQVHDWLAAAFAAGGDPEQL